MDQEYQNFKQSQYRAKRSSGFRWRSKTAEYEVLWRTLTFHWLPGFDQQDYFSWNPSGERSTEWLTITRAYWLCFGIVKMEVKK